MLVKWLHIDKAVQAPQHLGGMEATPILVQLNACSIKGLLLYHVEAHRAFKVQVLASKHIPGPCAVLSCIHTLCPLLLYSVKLQPATLIVVLLPCNVELHPHTPACGAAALQCWAASAHS